MDTQPSSTDTIQPFDCAQGRPSAPAVRPRLWRPTAIVFVSSACMMVLELVAGRIIAPYVGVSLYTWTSVIGVVLAGMSLGNYLGGRLADRWASPRLLGLIFLLGGLASLVILATEALGLKLPDAWPIVVRILVFTAALFFLPSMILGGVSPVVVKLAVHDLARTGSTVGRISAAGTVGSIVGTFATGFWLISQFGTHVIVWGVGIVLLVMALVFLLASNVPGTFGSAWHVSRSMLLRVLAVLGSVLALAGGTGLASAQSWLKSQCTLETNYFCIKVRDAEREGSAVRILILDRLVHSYSSLDNPKKLIYGYEQVYAEATDYAAAALDRRTGGQGHLRALFIGGGGYTFPRYMEAVYPGSELDVIEIDPGVTEVAYDLLGLRRDSPIASFNEDARMYLAGQPTKQYELIMGDAFNDYSVPYHLTTQEFNERVHAWLAPGGLYMVNMIDGPRREFLRAYTATLRRTFPYVYVAPAVRAWRDSPRVTFVLIASDAALDLDAFKTIDAGDGETFFANQVLSQAETDALLAEGPTVILTDRYAPVDQMLAPVVRGEGGN
ncbi:MAG: fused MFS/spermidine synthase [Chloroflexi bacterium]|nr:fused MFS/spermidine synthase [Chloroflexota bacterium]